MSCSCISNSTCSFLNCCKNKEAISKCNSSSSENSFKRTFGRNLMQNNEKAKRIDEAKLFLQEHSSRTGDNLLDLLKQIIERTIDERPRNVADYFEEFIRNVRKQKLPQSNVDNLEDIQFLEVANSVLKSFKFSFEEEIFEFVDESVKHEDSQATIKYSSESSHAQNAHLYRNLDVNENTLQFFHFWALCGFGFFNDEIFQLSAAVEKVQCHYTVESARFWGRIHGLRGSYYIVEASLTPIETHMRFNAMKVTLLEDMKQFIRQKQLESGTAETDPKMVPGAGWKNYPKDDLKKMETQSAPMPKTRIEDTFYVPPEPHGCGLNRKTYFVTTSLNEDWQELPVVTPDQIKASRKFKKYLTGNLNACLASYPQFLGTEKHYLRALIARITSGTYIAPVGFFRRMTKHELRLLETESSDRNEESVEEYESDEEDEDLYNDNDALIIPNSEYRQMSLKELSFTSSWVHIRPNILNQGRVHHLNEAKAIKDLEMKALLLMKGPPVYEEDDFPDESEELLEEFLDEIEEGSDIIETGPNLFSPCTNDKNLENILSWTSKFSSLYNKTNQMVLMRSNLWPGAYSMSFENFCDSIYIGWGFKYEHRCFSLRSTPIVETDHCSDSFEALDPTVEMEANWKKALGPHPKIPISAEMSEISVEFDLDDEKDSIEIE